jgi:hypothetical protein
LIAVLQAIENCTCLHKQDPICISASPTEKGRQPQPSDITEKNQITLSGFFVDSPIFLRKSEEEFL